MDISGVRWYHRLVKKNPDDKALLAEVKNPHTMFLVCATLPMEDVKKPKRLYAAFESVIAFVNKIKDIQQSNWYFFEIIMAEARQKLYFDLDFHPENINGDVDEYIRDMLDCLIGRISDVFRDKGHELDLEDNIMLFSSNSIKKRSYHIVVNGFCTDNNLENRALMEEITDGMPVGYLEEIDDSLYKPNQQLRLFLSQKPHSGRPKIFVGKYNYGPYNIVHKILEIGNDLPEGLKTSVRMMEIFKASAITYVEECKTISVIVKVKEKITPMEEDSVEIKKETLQEIVKNSPVAVFKVFEISEVIGSLVILRRKLPAMCSLCERVHDNENSFLRITNSGAVYYYCRRNTTKNKLLCNVTLPTDKEMSDRHARSALRYISRQPLEISPITGRPVGPNIVPKHHKLF